MEFVGRKYELEILEQAYREKTGRIIVFYGRRRVGKSEIIFEFSRNKRHLYFDGLEGEATPAQIKNFVFHLAQQLNQRHLEKTHFSNWKEVFEYLTTNVFSEKSKWIFALDELQWLAAGQGRLIAQIKSYWDQNWRKQGVLLIFFSQFKEHRTYEKIVNLLSQQPLSLEELADKLDLKSSGSFKSFLDNLELAGFIQRSASIEKTSQKGKKYKLIDEFLLFYFSKMRPLLEQIDTNTRRNLFNDLVRPTFTPWLGLAFERFCIRNIDLIAKHLKIENQVLKQGPLFSKPKGYQFDIAFIRKDHVVTLGEVKFWTQPVGVEVIKEMDQKIRKYSPPKGYSIQKVLITVNGATQPVHDLEFFDEILELKDFFQP